MKSTPKSKSFASPSEASSKSSMSITSILSLSLRSPASVTAFVVRERDRDEKKDVHPLGFAANEDNIGLAASGGLSGYNVGACDDDGSDGCSEKSAG